MFERILTMIRKDLRTSIRDQLVLYLLCSPLFIGLGLAFAMPMLERATPGFAVDAELDRAHVEELAALGPIEVLPDRAAVEARVLERDDVLGVVAARERSEGRNYEVLVEGDEPAALRELPARALELGVDVEQLRAGTAELREISTALATYAIAVIVGLIVGFAILEEKQTQTHRVYDVTPLRHVEYMIGKLGLGVVLSLLLVVPTLALPMGLDLAWPELLALVLAGTPFALTLGLIVAIAAKDQLGAIAVMKALLPVWTSIPVLGFVLPDAWQWTQWGFAHHWCVQGLFHVLQGDGVSILPHALLAFVLGLAALLPATWLLRRRLGLC
jgi:ABC-2 type transport system permease protein